MTSITATVTTKTTLKTADSDDHTLIVIFTTHYKKAIIKTDIVNGQIVTTVTKIPY